jgi:hypothetical protein
VRWDVGGDTWRGVDREVVAQQRGGVERAHAIRVHADRHVEFAALQSLEQLAGGGDREADVQLRVRPPELAHGVGAVVHGSDVDHAHPQPAHLPGADRAQPPGRLVEVGQHPLGGGGHRRGVLVGHPPSAVGGEQRHPEAALQFGDALRERRRGDPQRSRRFCPGAMSGDRHQVAQLGRREVRQHVVHIVKYC